MVDSSHHILIVALTVSIILSSFFTFLYIISPVTSPTGFATVNASGTVDISIPDKLSITLLNSTVNFGACAINRTQNYSLLDSSLGPTAVDNGDCTGGLYPSYLLVKNNGNLRANVTVSSNYTSDEFFNNSGSWYAYKIENVPDSPGCAVGAFQDNYTNFTTTSPLFACDNLSYLPDNNLFRLSIRTLIVENSSSKSSASITFEASTAS